MMLPPGPDPARKIAPSVSRRTLLLGIGTATCIGVGFGGYGMFVREWRKGNVINGWISIMPDGTVEAIVPGIELGQGATLALPMIVAEEMEADIHRVRSLPAPRDASLYGNPQFDGRMVTADSRTTSGYFDILRLAGAQARLALISAACRMSNWRPGDCVASAHAVRHQPSGASIGFGDIAKSGTFSTGLPMATAADLKPRHLYALVGTSPIAPRAAAIGTGCLRYGIDGPVDDGALIALIVRGDRIGSAPDLVEDTDARKVRGMVDVVRLGDGVAVVARSMSAAMQARTALKVTFRGGVDYDSRADLERLEKLAREGRNVNLVRDTGQIDVAQSGAARIYRETYASAHVSHLAMEPLTATARPTMMGLGVAVSSPTQSLDLDMRYAARAYKTLPLVVSTAATASGGAYGRRVLNDIVADAATLCKLMKQPVQVVRLPADELKHGQVRPANGQFVEAGVDEHGNLVSWRHTVVSDSVLARHLPETFEKRGRIDNTATDGLLHSYRVPNARMGWRLEPAPPTPGFLRGVSAGYVVFAIETMVDRIARDAGQDPLQWRLDHLGAQDERRVLMAASEIAGWPGNAPDDGALGLAFMTFRGSHVATIADVSSARRVRALHIAADVGLAIHPKNVEAQIEGGALTGLSIAMAEELVFKEGRAQSDGVSDYPMLSPGGMPVVRVKLVGQENATRPRGVGEIGVPTIAPAVANAIAKLTGKRLNRLPFAMTRA